MNAIPSALDFLRAATLSVLMLSTGLALPIFQKLHVFGRTCPSSSKGGLLPGAEGSYGTSVAGGSHGKGTVYKVSSAGEVSIIVNFNGSNGSEPYGGLIVGPDGNYYGTTSNGGIGTSVVYGASTINYGGTVFRLTPEGEITTLANFTGANGIAPTAKLVVGPNGNFYGTTSKGGTTMAGTDLGKGTVFKLTPSGELTTLNHFSGSNGSTPGPLTVGKDGNFYGVTQAGGASNIGTIFRMQPSGKLTTLVHFNGANGHTPNELVHGLDGNFYGTTNTGGANYYGTFFRMTPTGVFTTLASFSVATGRNPGGPLCLRPDGSFIGSTSDNVFKVTPAGVITPLFPFNETNGMGGTVITPGWDEDFYGATTSGGRAGMGTVFRVTSDEQFDVVAHFQNSDGTTPRAGLMTGPQNRLYGTTESGGTFNKGTIFAVSLSGAPDTLMSFNGANGMFPHAELTPGPDGSLYGSTYGNGLPAVSYPSDYLIYGSAFKITPSFPVEFSSLISFDKSNGALPVKGLTLGPDGNFYGTTGGGPWVNHSGSLFRMTPAGTLTTLVQFDFSTNGRFPSGKLAVDADGNLYGATTDGGGAQYGTVFKVTPGGNLTTLVDFNGANGRNPQGVVLDSSGDLYGTTGSGTSPSSDGKVFKITKSGTFTTLLTFNGITHGRHPGRLTLGPDGNFYGTASYGGSSSSGGQTGAGTIFRISPTGVFTMLHNFDETTGSTPNDELHFGPDGHLYGTTLGGGISPEVQAGGAGVIYRLHFGPEVTTRIPSAPYLPDVTLHATVDPHGFDTSVSFRIGTDPEMNVFETFSAGVVPAGNSSTDVQAVVAGLQPDTTYYFRAVASNPENPVPQLGDIEVFVTSPELVVEDADGKLISHSAKLPFGSVASGKFRKRTITLRNQSDGVALSSISASIGGRDAPSFSVVSNPPETIAHASSGIFSVRFSPDTPGQKTATLSIFSNDTGYTPYEIQLTGTCTSPTSEIAIQQPSRSDLVDGLAKKSFGTVKVGEQGAAKTFTIRNIGSATLSKLAISKDGMHGGDFIVDPLAKNSIPPGGSITFKAIFQPKAKGVRNAALHIKSNDTDESPFDIKLTGTGVMP